MKTALFIILSLAFTGCSCSGSGSPGVSTVAEVGGEPDGITYADSGNTYVTDSSSGEIVQIDRDGKVTTIEDTGSAVTINHPDGITAVTTGTTDTLYVADMGADTTGATADGKILKITVDSGTVTTTEFSTGTALITPTGIATDDSGNLYVADEGASDIYKISPDGTTQSITGGASTADLENPHGVTLVENSDGSKTLYSTDPGTASNNIIKIDIPSSGVAADAVAVEFTPDNTGGTDSGTTSTAKFNSPHGITTDRAGAIFICDENNNRVQLITPTGKVITFAGNGEAGDRDGAADIAEFSAPRGIAVDSNDDILVCDAANGKVKKITR